MKNILLIIDSLNVGGAQRQLVVLAKLLKQENKVTVLVYYNFATFLQIELKNLGVEIIYIPKKYRFDIIFIIKLLKFIRKNKFDISISFLDTPNFYNEVARLFKAVPKIIVCQRSAYFSKDITYKKKFFENFHMIADHITANSKSQVSRMKTLFPAIGNKVSYLPNAYSIPIINEENYNFINEFIILSNLNHYKNPLNLTKALIEYKTLYGKINFKINWYGRLPIIESDKINFRLVQKLIIQHKLNDHLSFKGITEKPFEKIIYHDALIHISNYEGCPNSVCEAMALMKPVILSNVCDHPYLVSNGNGLLVNQLEPLEIAQTINKFINHPPVEKLKMGKLSREFIIKNMSEENLIFTINKIIHKLC